jgi:glycosyltransferase involved in cell wall biosynthesis
MTPRVTVAVPVYNGARFLARTLQSLLGQEYDDFQVIVVDDCSSDDSVGIARALGVTVIQNETRRGLAGNWNSALTRTTSPLVVLAHQDDVYARSFLATTARLLNEYPRAFAAHTRAQYVDAEGNPVESAASRYKDGFWPQPEPAEREPRDEVLVLQRGNYVICPAVMLRMAAVRDIGLFNEQYRFVPDWEYWLRGLLRGHTLVGTHARLIDWRRHEGTATRAEEGTFRRYDEELALQHWLANAANLPLHTRSVENTVLSEFAARLAGGDRAGAAALSAYARTRLPRTKALLAFGMAGGQLGGKALQWAERLYTRIARPGS